MPTQPQNRDQDTDGTTPPFSELDAAVADLGAEVQGLIDDVLDNPEASDDPEVLVIVKAMRGERIERLAGASLGLPDGEPTSTELRYALGRLAVAVSALTLRVRDLEADPA